MAGAWRGAMKGTMGNDLRRLHHLISRSKALPGPPSSAEEGWEKLQAAQDCRRLLEGAEACALMLLDRQGRVTRWNRGAERITGFAASELQGLPFSRFYLPEDAALGGPEAILRLAATLGRVTEDGWMVRQSGARYFVNGVVTACLDTRGDPLGFTAAIHDITAHKANQAALQSLAEDLEGQVEAQCQELRENESRLQGFIHHAPAAIACRGLDGRYLMINPKMEALLGRPARDILGRCEEELLPWEVGDGLDELRQPRLRTGQELQGEGQWPQADGSTRHFQVDKFLLVDGTGQGWGTGIIATEITERKQVELALVQRQKLESLGILAGGIAHDFNNLLGAMQGNLELAMTGASRALARPYQETAIALMAKAAGLVQQMLAYAGKGQAQVHPLDLNKVVAEMLQFLDASIAKQATLRLELYPQPLAMIGDLSQLQQVVMNLVINGTEALADPSGVITVRTRPELTGQGLPDPAGEAGLLPPGANVCLEVQDNGVGMTAEV